MNFLPTCCMHYTMCLITQHLFSPFFATISWVLEAPTLSPLHLLLLLWLPCPSKRIKNIPASGPLLLPLPQPGKFTPRFPQVPPVQPLGLCPTSILLVRYSLIAPFKMAVPAPPLHQPSWLSPPGCSINLLECPG